MGIIEQVVAADVIRLDESWDAAVRAAVAGFVLENVEVVLLNSINESLCS